LETLVYRQTVQPLQAGTLTRYMPFSGLFDDALFHFPSGCNGLVEVLINHRTVQIFPFPPGGLALDDATERWRLNENVIKNDPIEVVVLNHDNLNPHTITVTIHIDETALEKK